MTRARGAGLNPSGLPDEALDMLLERTGHARVDVSRFVAAGFQPPTRSCFSGEIIERPHAHALAAYLSSPFSHAAVLVCDHGAPSISLWRGRGADLEPIASAWDGPGFVDLYSRCAEVVGFHGDGHTQRLEALARPWPGYRDVRIDRLFAWIDGRLRANDGWERVVDEVVRDASSDSPWQAQSLAAAAFQSRLIDLVLELMADVRSRLDDPVICLGGSLFYHSSINTAIRQSRLFADVFVPIDPGEAGLAVGAALYAQRSVPRDVEPFLGPRYRADEIKETLDNCKLPYTWE
ncbi:MAG: hypothetical protein FJW27_09285 [Acidimicrobiia bacterium]|nr:hypothetical protein [Acidimicrobiia bacterium]